MKYFLCYLSVLVFTTTGEAQQKDVYYWYKGEKQALEIKEDKWFLLFDHQPEQQMISREIQVKEEQIVAPKKVYSPGDTVRYWTEVQAERREINLDTSVISYHAPYFYSETGKEVGLSHLFYVKLHDAEDIEQLEELAKKHQIEILNNNKFRPLWYTLACDRNSTGNALEMANLFFETGLFDAAEPDLMAPGV